jgi:lipopolysaccharide transport system permease protein
VVTKLVEFAINFGILLGLMAWYGIAPGVQALWAPLLLLYTVLAALTVALLGAAINVYYRDVGQMLPVLLSLLMYFSPVIYPLQLVRQKLLVERVAGAWSDIAFMAYTANPLAGIIDAFQRTLLKGLPPDPQTMLPGMLMVAVLLPLSYVGFKRAESHFADIV